jgi:hypothetical protein
MNQVEERGSGGTAAAARTFASYDFNVRDSMQSTCLPQEKDGLFLTFVKNFSTMSQR